LASLGANKAIQNGENSFAELLNNYIDQKNDNGAILLGYIDRYISHVCQTYHLFTISEQEDIRQELAIVLLCQGAKYRDSFTKRLLYIMVRNQCLDQLRKQTRHLSTFVSSVSDEDLQSAPAPSLSDGADADLFQHLNCLERIFGEIEAQPTGQEDVRIYTQYAFGLSHLEISQSAKRSVTAVARRLSILRGRLNKLKNELC
jgi:DNA-directed RNA polymerase specialized sigma24 family protein